MSESNIPIDEDWVRDCLIHLYDYPFLQEHPFVRLLIPHVQGNASRVQMFRQTIFEAIDQLKPDDSANPHTKTSRLYTILHLRYQQQQQVQFILKQLNLGERQFYRDHTKAVHALAGVLEEHLQEGGSQSASAFSIHAELKRVQGQSILVNTRVEDFLSKTLTAIKSLSERQQSDLTIEHCNALLPETLDQTLLRQVIIWIVSQLIIQAPPGSHFTIWFDQYGSSAQFTFTRKVAGDQASAGLEGQRLLNERQETLETLLNALGATVFERVNERQDIDVILTVSVEQHAVLIIDDNPDVIALFRQFLLGRPYQLFAAQDGLHAIALAHETHPELIILDVLLPNQDGWDILQQLKNHPTTVDTPVLICSVLDAHDLALLLGANGFLHKPPEENEFLEALKRATQVSRPA